MGERKEGRKIFSGFWKEEEGFEVGGRRLSEEEEEGSIEISLWDNCGRVPTHTQEEEKTKKCTHSVVGRKKDSWKGTRNLHFSLPTRLEKRGF